MIKKTISIFICLTMLSAFAASANTAVPGKTPDENIQIIVDGTEIFPTDVNGKTVAPFLSEGTTYLPLRAVSAALGMEVNWDSESHTAFIGTVPATSYTVSDVVRIVVNGTEITPKDVNGNVVSPLLIDGTTYIPVRAVSEALGKEVSWDGVTRTVYLGEATVNRDAFEINSRSFTKFNNRTLLTINSHPVNGDIFTCMITLIADDSLMQEISENYSATGTLQSLLIESEPAAKFFTAYIESELLNIYALYDAAEKSGLTQNAAFMAKVEENLPSDDELMKEAYYLTSTHSFDIFVAYREFIRKQTVVNIYTNEILNLKKGADYSEKIAEIEEKVRANYVTAKHILVEDESLAKEIIAKIEKGENFDALMKEHNTDPGATEKGYTFTKGEMVEPFEKAAFELKENEFTKTPVKTNYGYHIIWRLPFDEEVISQSKASWTDALATQAAQAEFDAITDNVKVEHTPEYEKYITTIR